MTEIDLIKEKMDSISHEVENFADKLETYDIEQFYFITDFILKETVKKIKSIEFQLESVLDKEEIPVDLRNKFEKRLEAFRHISFSLETLD